MYGIRMYILNTYLAHKDKSPRHVKVVNHGTYRSLDKAQFASNIVMFIRKLFHIDKQYEVLALLVERVNRISRISINGKPIKLVSSLLSSILPFQGYSLTRYGGVIFKWQPREGSIIEIEYLDGSASESRPFSMEEYQKVLQKEQE